MKGFKDVHLKNGSSQGQKLKLTVLSVLTSLDSGQQGAKEFLVGIHPPFCYLIYMNSHVLSQLELTTKYHHS